MESQLIIEHRLGTGATAEVFRARRNGDQTLLALKVFLPMIAHDPDAVLRIQQEAEVLSQLRHPHIVQLIRFTSEPLQLELEYVDGSSLKRWSQDFKIDLLEPRLWVLSRVAQALGYAHERRILHRDLKPENILVSRHGEVKLSDFGLARSLERITMTKSGVLLGSLGYMAPEILNLETASEKSDLFSFGVVAYELLTGQMPFDAPSPHAVIKKLSEGKFIPMRQLNSLVPKDVAECIEACMAPQASHRPENIWVVESVLMTTLSRSGLISSCQDLVGLESRPQAVQRALQAKLATLSSKIKWALSEKQLATVWLETQEYQRLFPDGELNEPVMSGLISENQDNEKATRTTSRRRTIVIAFAVLLVSGIGLLLGQGLVGRSFDGWNFILKSEPIAALTPPVLLTDPPKMIEAEIPKPQPAPVERVAVEKANRPSRPARVATEAVGYLAFELPDDVQVFVDAKLAPREMMRRFPAKPGTRDIRMVKEGFLPIDSQILVKPGATAKVRAGTP